MYLNPRALPWAIGARAFSTLRKTPGLAKELLAFSQVLVYVLLMTHPLIALSMPGMPELIFILVVVLLLFGAKKLPELARGLGQSLGEFKKAREEFEREVHKSSADLEVKPAPSKEAFQPTVPADAEKSATPPKTA
jgi:sec-independent protein translocase protein TatA